MRKRRKIVLAVIGSLAAGGLVIVLAAPAIMRALGLHPDYDGQRYLLPEGKALVIATNHDRLGEDGRQTGVFGSELTSAYYEFLDARMQVDVASIEGGEIPWDPWSLQRALKTGYDDRYLSDPVLQSKTENSLPIDDLDFTEYDIVYLAGGWGAAYDLGYSEELGRKVSDAYAGGTVVGGVCHGLLGLLLATDENGTPLVEGRRITAVTDKQVDELNIDITPMHPERELRAAGAIFESETAFRDIFANHVVVDDRIVSGQNQNAGPEVANLMIEGAGGTRR